MRVARASVRVRTGAPPPRAPIAHVETTPHTRNTVAVLKIHLPPKQYYVASTVTFYLHIAFCYFSFVFYCCVCIYFCFLVVFFCLNCVPMYV